MDSADLTILCIDDELLVLNILGDYLRGRGYRVVLAQNASDGLEVFKWAAPDLILVDLRMPEKDGLSFLTDIKAIDPEIPVIVISGVGAREDVIASLRKGAWNYLTKPFEDFEVLDYAVNDALEKARLIRENREYREFLEKRVKERTAALNRLNEELEERVIERTKEISDINTALAETIKELQTAQGQLVQSEKMAALGNLVAGVAHEVNTPLGVGITAISFLIQQVHRLKKSYEEGQVRREEFESHLYKISESAIAIQTNLTRAAHLIRSFKQVAVDHSGEKRRVFNVGEYIESLMVSLKPRFKTTPHNVRVFCDPEIVMDSYPGLLGRIITNLVMNALTHGIKDEPKGELSVSCFKDGAALVLEVADTGQGIDNHIQEKMYDPFYTTNRQDGGAGLGLHIVFNLVTQSLGGHIYCTSKPGKGTTFTIRLPLTPPEDGDK